MTELLTRPHRIPGAAAGPAAHPSPATVRVRPRWRGASTAVSWLLVVAATVGGVHLGLAAPAVSPVAPPVAVVAPQVPTAATAPTDGRGPGRGQGGRRG